MKWSILNKSQITNRKSQTNTNDQISEIQNALLENRGVVSKKEKDEFLNPSLDLLDKNFFDEGALEKAQTRIASAVKNKERVIVYSDYDVDGITGTAILWEVLHGLGANALPFVPHRMKHGYGLSEKGIAEILNTHPDTKLIITVDNGISASDAVSYANEKGIDVIITDHHTKPDTLPDAHAIIHTTELSGSGVAYVFSQYI